MACSGPLGDGLSVRGSYAALPGPDWGWRIDLRADGEGLRLLMWNVWPAEQGSKEEPAVEAVYAGVAPGGTAYWCEGRAIFRAFLSMAAPGYESGLGFAAR